MTKKQGILKVALLQFCAGPHKAANLAKALSLSQEALSKNARFILLPEVFNGRGDARNKEWLTLAAEKIPGPSTNVFVPLAKKYKTAFLLGSILEKARDTFGLSPAGAATSGHVYNTSVFIDSQGNLSAKYRKIHLFDARIGDRIIRESDCMRAGRGPVMAQAAEFWTGLSICYDLRFPRLYQQYARRGAEILAVPSCFTRKTGEAHWETLLRARAIENLAYVLAPNQTGVDLRGMQAHGHSMIISPWGEIIAQGSGDKEEIIYGEIDIAQVHKARHILPGIIKERSAHSRNSAKERHTHG